MHPRLHDHVGCVAAIWPVIAGQRCGACGKRTWRGKVNGWRGQLLSLCPRCDHEERWRVRDERSIEPQTHNEDS